MKFLSLVLLLALAAILAPHPTRAQQANVVTSCGSVAPFGALTPGTQAFPTIDVNGNLCLSGGGGGGGVSSLSTKCGLVSTSGPTVGAATVNSNVLPVPKSASYAIVGADCGSVFVVPAAAAAGVVLTLPDPATAGSGWSINGIANLSSNSVSVASPSGTFNGVASPMTIASGQGVNGLATNGTDWTYVPATASAGGSASIHSGYVSGNYYPPNAAGYVAGGSSSAKAANTLYCQPLIVVSPGYLADSLTLGLTTTDVAATGLWAAAIYLNSTATGKPTGLPVATTQVTGLAVNIGVAAPVVPFTVSGGSTATTASVPTGFNWLCEATASTAMRGTSITNTPANGWAIGNSNISFVITASTSANGYNCLAASTCGTGGTNWNTGTGTMVWPNMNSPGTLNTQLGNSANMSGLAFRVH